MSVLRPLHSRRGRLVFVAAALLLMSVLVAAPSVSGAAAVKQFTATITPDTATGGVTGTWTERVKNCGTPIAAPCTANSTIAIGQIRITVPPEFRSEPPDFSVSVIASNGSSWTASYVSGVITAQPANASNKLNSGEFVDIAIQAIPECIAGSKEFTTTAVGGLPNGPNNQTFLLVSPNQPSVTIAGCQLASGGSATDPATGQTETVEGDFQGHVNLTFGEPGGDCGGPEFGALGDQWQQYHLPSPVTITPAADFVAGSEDKISTSEFDQDIFGGDSSWYLICYAVPQDGHTRFVTRGGGLAVAQTVGGVLSWVGILANCADAPTPCVTEQFLTTGPGAPPWTPSANRVHIANTMDPGDPHRT
ncbi:MAG TPA: hypothetical protein VGL16_15610 [Actinomycetota bacterium]